MNRMCKVLPITSAQAGMWISEKVGRHDVVFNLAEYVEIHGRIEPDVFRAALLQLTSEIETTRLRIVEQDGQAFQLVMDHFAGEFEVLDFSGQRDGLQQAIAWMQDEVQRPVRLDVDRLWTSALLKLGENHWIWYHRVHHVAFDGFVGGLVARRLAHLYTAFVNGEAPEPAQFGPQEDLLSHEAAYRSSTHFEKDRAYWLEQLKQLPPPVTLARSGSETAGGLLRHRTTLERSRIQPLEDISKGNGGSLPQALIALVASYMARATNTDDLVIVTMVTARLNAAARRIPGMMANAVPLRFHIASETSWVDLTRQAAQQMSRALRYQRYRYEDMRRDLGMVRQDEQIAWLGINIEPFDYDLRFDGAPTTVHNLSNGTMTDLTVFAYDRGDGSDLCVDFDANAGLYSKAELVEHDARFQRLLDAVLANPDMPLAQIDLLSEEERQQVMVDWNRTQREVPDQTWPELFDQQVARNPQAVALRFEDQSLTYAALKQDADTMARQLIDRGVKPGDLVAVAVPRSERMVVALLAVLKAGAAYLPLDPADPASRIGVILEDGAPSAIITTSDILQRLGAGHLPHLLLDTPLAEPVTQDLPQTQGDDTAYVIFTSGSTGRPKGVQIPHRALVNFLFAMQDLLALTPDDRLLAVTTIAFDIAALELFLPLFVGSSAVIATRDTVKDPRALSGLITSTGVTVMQATPSLWRMLLDDYLPSLRGLRALVGGEALPADLAQRMAQLGHPVMNLYGPTETTIWSTAMALSGDDLLSTPIGRPIWNTRVYVLDRSLNLVPPGTPGELFIAGAGVAKGYLNRPDLTAERFLPDPFSPTGGRMYRTGDQAAWRPDGTLAYLGRNDHQIKIRGFRVEPGEIEAALVSLPEIRQAVVVLREDPGTDKQLVAYVVAADGAAIDSAAILHRLADQLPGHMVPAALVGMDRIPLNSNGKIDRNALPAPAAAAPREFVAPRTEMERAILEIWTETLKRDAISVHDSFFDIGGDSLSAARMVAQLRNRLDCDLPLVSIFEQPTIAGIACQIGERGQTTPLLDQVLPIRTTGTSAPLFCIHPVLGVGWGFFTLAQYVPEDIPIYALQSPTLVAGARMPDSIESIAEAYVRQIRSIQPEGPYHMVGWSLGGLVAHEMARILRDDLEDVAFLSLLDAYPYHQYHDHEQPKDITLVRAALTLLGIDPASAPDVRTVDDLGPYFFKLYDLENNPLAMEVQRRDPDLLDRMQKLILHHIEIARDFVPGQIDVDVHFFQANHTASDDLGSVLKSHPDAWLAHTSGSVSAHRLNCLHHEMLDPRNAPEIGRVLQTELLRDVVRVGLPAYLSPAMTA